MVLLLKWSDDMLNIAICDDDNIFCKYFKRLIQKVCLNLNLDANIQIYNNGESLCDKLEANIFYDLIFLDIELITMSGMDIGSFIRNDLQNQVMQIIYVSSKQGYAMKLFKTRPMDFLLKPIEETQVEECIKTYINNYLKDVSYFQFTFKDAYFKLNIKDIMYFESNLRKVIIYTANNQYEIYNKLSILDKEPSLKDFWYVHKSYLVNPIYIQKYLYNEIILTNDKVIPVSRSQRNMIREKVFAQGGIL